MTQYRELIVKGDDRDLIPYLAGFLVGSGTSGIYFAEESGFHVHALRERFRHHGEVQHVVCMEESCAAIREALAKAVPRYRFEVKAERTIARALFRFEVETPSRNVAQVLRESLTSLPPGTTLAGFAPREDINSESKGTELYSPVHDYEFRASGEVQGDVEGVIKMRQRLCTIEFVKCNEIELFEN